MKTIKAQPINNDDFANEFDIGHFNERQVDLYDADLANMSLVKKLRKNKIISEL